MKLPGHRIIKTTVSVFVTAFICVQLNWPPVFAVITAIVTLEPSIKDSVKKGLVRFPASAIGSFYAVLFISLFGNSPLTYTLAASLTILTCYQLRLNAGLLVATITAVAMVEVVYDNYWMSFLIRLGTTTTGIVVSTLVNIFILPPDYTSQIKQHIKQVNNDTGELLKQFTKKQTNSAQIKQALEQIARKIRKTELLISFQTDQADFQPFIMTKNERLQHFDEELHRLKLMQYHLNNIAEISMQQLTFSKESWHIIEQAIYELALRLQGSEKISIDEQENNLRALLDLFWKSPHPAYKEEDNELPHELTLLYEMVSLYYISKQRYQTLQKKTSAPL